MRLPLLSSVWTHRLSRLARGLSWALLALGLLIALAWGLLHVWIVPRIGDFRPEIEQLSSRATGLRVQIGQVQAQSTGWVPSFELEDIRLLDSEGRDALRLPRVVVAISIQSVLSLGLDQLVFDAPELDIRRTRSGQWLVAGLPLGTQEQGDSPLADWLFAQKEVVVRQGAIRWSDELAAQPLAEAGHFSARDEAHVLALSQVDVVLRNSPRRHELRVDATPPEGWGERFVLMGRFRRELLSQHPGRWRDWSGQAYALLAHVDVRQLRRSVQLGLDVASGQGRVRAWADLQRGRWSGGQLDLDLKDLHATLGQGLEPLAFAQISGRLSGKFPDLHGSWSLATRELAFRTEGGGVWSGGNVSLRHSAALGAQPASSELQGEQLDLQTVRDLALRLPLPDHTRAQLQDHRLEGQVKQLTLRWQGPWSEPKGYALKTTVEQLAFEPVALNPTGAGSPAPRRAQPASATGSRPAVVSSKTNRRTPAAAYSPGQTTGRASAQASTPAPALQLGLRGARAQIELSESAGQLSLSMAPGSRLLLGGVLEDPVVPLTSLQADLRWDRAGGQWRVPQWKLRLVNPDLAGQWQGQWQPGADGQGPGVLDLQGQIARIEAARIHRYLPQAIPADVRRYVRDAVTRGSASDVQVRVRGDLAQWPFPDARQGEFRFAGRVRDLQMAYLPASLQSAGEKPWPEVRGIKGELVFDGLNMQLKGASGTLGEALAVNNLRAEIANLVQQPVVEVQAELRGSASQALRVVQQSPLSGMLEGALDSTQASGTLAHQLKLAIPILAIGQTKVQGSVTLQGNDLQFGPGLPVLEKAQGTIQYTESGFALQGAQARLLGGPAWLEGGLRPAPGQSAEQTLQLRAEGSVSAEGLQQYAAAAGMAALARQVTGSTAYSATLGWRGGHPELSVNSSLQGLGLNLPAPLGKPAAQALALRLDTRVQNVAGQWRDRVQIDWGQAAAATYVRDVSGPWPLVLQGQLSLGQPRSALPPLPEQGVSARLSLPELSLDQWQALLGAPASAEGPAASDAATRQRDEALRRYLPNRMALQVGQLVWDQRTLHDVQAEGTREGTLWKTRLLSREASGDLEYQQGEGAGRLRARLQRLNLPAAAENEVVSMLEGSTPYSLPALDIVVQELELRGKKLGQVEIEAVNMETAGPRGPSREWRLNRFNLKVPEASLNSTGRWLSLPGGARRTELQFRLDVRDAGDLLTRLGTPGALKGGAGQLAGQLAWAGTPMALHYPSMSGNFRLDMGRGQFLKADAGAAKLLGVLSLQALPRRLILDFRDVFSEGFAFDSARGDVTIAQGIASTRNLQIRGVNALVQMEGSADIAHETQDLRVVILPELDAGTASLVAGMALNPAIGITTFLAQLFLRQPLQQANTQSFVIDGTWSDPRITRVPTASLAPAAAGASTPAPAPAPVPAPATPASAPAAAPAASAP